MKNEKEKKSRSSIGREKELEEGKEKRSVQFSSFMSVEKGHDQK